MRFPKGTLLVLSVLVCALLCLPQSAMGQAVYGSIFGTVTDPTGAVVPNAKVTITNVNKNTKFETTTNESGNYSRTQLISDLYQIEVEAAGFRKALLSNITVNADVSSREDVKLEVGNVSEQVEVTAEAPMLKSDRSDVAVTLSTKMLNELPSFGRNWQAYELLVPGTQKLGWQHASSENPQGSLQIMVNGQNFSGTGFQLDGTDNQDPILGIVVINPTLESVTESKFTTQNYDAEFGLAIAGMMTAQTKSGTNELHGSLFEYIRDNTPGFTTFARNPFNSAENTGVPPVKWNQFGGSAGGPIKKNKLFYFGDVQITRRRTGSSVLTGVPTLKARTGDFSEYLEPLAGAALVPTTQGNMVPFQRNMIFDPLTGDPTTGVGRQAFQAPDGTLNVIPQSRLSPQTLALLKYFPNPNAKDIQGSPFRRNYAAAGSENFDTNQWNTRIDYFASEKMFLFGRYSWANFKKFSNGAFGELAGGPALDNVNFAGKSDVRNQSLAAGVNYTINPTLLTEFRFGFMRYRVAVLPNGLGTTPAKDAGIPGLNGLNGDNFFTTGMPRFQATGDGGVDLGYSLGTNQCNCPLDEQEQQFQFVNNTTKIHGNHSIKFGADIRYAMNLRVPSDSHRAGELYFDPGYTGYVSTKGASVQQGLGLATFFLGETTNFSRYVSSSTNAAERQKRMFWYLQDTWRVTNKLSLNYGVRWDMIFPEKVNAPGNGGALDLSTGLINVYGIGQVGDHGIVDMNWKNLAPRLGVTYQVGRRTVVRAGYGWSYTIGTFGSIFGHNVTQNVPVLAYQQLSRPTDFLGVFTLDQGPAPPTFLKPDANGQFLLPDGINGKARPNPLRLPRVMAHNITVQHQLTDTVSLEVGYVGNVGRHTFTGDGPNYNVNAPAFIPGVSDNTRKPYFLKYGWTQGIDWYCSCATTEYDSLQIKLEKRFAKGYGVVGHYTYGRGVQDDDDGYSFLYNRALARGVNGWDRTHIWVVAQNFDVPVGKGKHFLGQMGTVGNAIVGGWQLNAITSVYGGLPFTPGFDAPSGAIRPNAGPSGRPDKGSQDPFAGAKKNRDQWYVGGLGGAFLVPADNTFGNYGRNTLRGPRLFQQDLSIFKNFKPRENMTLQVRAEAFNAFNHTNLGQPESNVTSGDAGKITSLAASGGDNALGVMRRMQFGFRLQF
ncbi:MAG: TonB-dependent receptor [Acidobacteria bacterium]|nr:TonB-dependent receptor [Acidobacteriota bacterium]